MLMRRDLMLGAAAYGAGAPGLMACSSGDDAVEAARSLRRPIVANTGDRAVLMQEMVRYAALAPSSHNTQCWKFRVNRQAPQRSIRIEPDLARRTPVVDPDDHHLFVSLGCAAENLVQAALAHGWRGHARYEAPSIETGAGAIAVGLEATQALSSPLFQAITERQCTRGDYDGQALTTAELRLLEQAGTGNGVRVMLLTERAAMENVLAYVVSGNTAQMNDPAFVDELTAWIRFGADEASRTGDGLYSGAAGNPSLPRWLGTRAMGLFFTPQSENDRYARQIRNSAGIAVFASEASDKAHWVEVGRCYERFALQATALGIRNAFLNQPVEVGSIRPQFASAIGLDSPRGQRPDLVVRFGRGPTMPYSLRRPVRAVLVPAIDK